MAFGIGQLVTHINMSKRLLLVSFHFPPIQGSSGVHRALSFARYLPDKNWGVTVLTAHERAHQDTNPQNLNLIPTATKVIRGFALDSQQHLSFKGRFLRATALPDRWQSWIFGGVLAALSPVLRGKFDAIMSTYPIASAQLIGYALHRISRIPWIVDFRDPMAQEDYPSDPSVRRIHAWVEAKAFKHASAIIVVSPGTHAYYQTKYPDFDPAKLHVIPNGYDEGVFEQSVSTSSPTNSSRPIEILHSGLMYPDERDPSQLFAALAELLAAGSITSETLHVNLRAAGNEKHYERMIADAGLGDIVTLSPPVDYNAAVAEMLDADVLMVCQAEICNGQIPAKLYEYIYACRPILSLSDPVGDTGSLLIDIGCPYVAALENKQAIKQSIIQLVNDISAQTTWTPDKNVVDRYSRRHRAHELGAILEKITGAVA